MGKAGFIMRGARGKVGTLVMMKGENRPISGCFETVERKAVLLQGIQWPSLRCIKNLYTPITPLQITVFFAPPPNHYSITDYSLFSQKERLKPPLGALRRFACEEISNQ